MSTPTMKDLEAAIKGYQTRTMTQRERALSEMRLWDMFGRVVPGERPRREKWMEEMLGVEVSASNVRQTLIRSGDWTIPIFKRLDEGLAASTASRIHTAVLKRERMQGGSREDLLKEVLRMFDALVRALGPARAHFTTSLDRWVEGESIDTIIASVRKAPQKKRSANSHARPTSPARANGSAAHRDTILSAVEPHIEPFLDAIGAPEAFRAEVVQGFVVQLTMLLDDFEREAQRAVKAPMMTDVSKTEFTAACNVASVQAEWGRPLDWPAVKRHVGKMQAQFHPDITGGEWKNDSQRHRYEQLGEALDVLERYQRQVFGKKPQGD